MNIRVITRNAGSVLQHRLKSVVYGLQKTLKNVNSLVSFRGSLYLSTMKQSRKMSEKSTYRVSKWSFLGGFILFAVWMGGCSQELMVKPASEASLGELAWIIFFACFIAIIIGND